MTASSGILDRFFTPLESPFESSVDTQENKDYIDHVSEYLKTSEGAWDFFRVVNQAANLSQAMTPQHGELVGRVRDIADTAGLALSVPQIFSNSNQLRCSVNSLISSRNLSDSDPLRTKKIAQAAKNTFVDALNLTNTCSQAALFVNQVKIFPFELSQLKILDGINNVTSAISDGIEFVGECFKLKQYHSPEIHPRNPAEEAKLSEKKTLAWMTIAKDVASIALAAITLVSIVFGLVTHMIPLVAAASLALSAFWLAMKLASYFYKKIIVDQSYL